MSTLTTSPARKALRRTASLVLAPLLLVGALAISPAGAASLNVSFTVTNANFGAVTVGTTSTSQVVVTNTSTVPLYFKSATIHGGATGDFTDAPAGCAGALAIGASCDIGVSFTPLTRGHRAASLGIAMGAKNPAGKYIASATIQSSLSGKGLAPTLTLTNGSAGSIDVGSSGIASSVLTNTSAVGLNLESWSLQGVVRKDFSIAAVTCASPIGPSQSCDIVVVFRPSVAGNVSATLDVTLAVVGAHDKWVTAHATISGDGVRTGGRSTIVSLSSLDFGTVTIGTSASGSVAIVNNSTGAVAVSHFAIGGNAEKEFALGTNTCGASLAAGATCDVNLTFTPAFKGLRNATLAVRVVHTSGAKTYTSTVLTSLSGIGLKPTVSLTAPAFGSVTIGSSTVNQVVASNTSLAAVTFKSANITGPHQPSWTVSSTTCTGALAPGASCEIELTFAPHSVGDLSTVLSTVFTITTTNAHVVHTVFVYSGTNVAATGTLPSFSAAAAALGPTAQGVAVSESATITNTSDVALSYSSSHISGTNAGDFSVTNSTCVAQIAPTGSCTLTLTFDPTAAGSGTDSASLDVTLSVDGITPITNVSLDTAISGAES